MSEGDEVLCACLLDKIREQIERTTHLIGLVDPEQLNWKPPFPEGRAWTVGQLIGHLLECLAGICAVLYAAEPRSLQHFAELRVWSESACEPPGWTPADAAARIAVYQAHIEEGFAVLRDADLARRLPTVFVADGEPIFTLLLGNLEHLINHKHQLFTYLQQMGVPAATPDLYRFRA